METIISSLVGYGIIVMIALITVMITLLVAQYFRAEHPLIEQFKNILNQYGLLIMFGVIVGSIAGSLYYSSIGYAPCVLCWWQRMMIYPQVVVLGSALWAGGFTKQLRLVSLILASIGIVIAIWHVGLQSSWGFVAGIPCAATSGVYCNTVPFKIFGFITIPIMSFVVQLFISLINGITFRNQL